MSHDALGTAHEAAATAVPAQAPELEQVPVLTVDALTVRFSGLLALDAVSFTVAPGTIHALIGPNGAGKSTCFNVVSGVYRATAGSVRYADQDLTRLPPHRIARLGVARTFQNIVLTNGSVAENLMLGRHSLTRAGFAATALRLPSVVREQRRHRERAAEIADFLGLGPVFDKPVGSLAYGDRKRVEMARALCMEPKLLMLDEPVAGMHPTERAAMAETIAMVRDALGISILIVEHDMGLIMRIADAVTVLDFGRRIADGPPERIQRDPAVISAYLGRTDEDTPAADTPAQDTGAHDEGTHL
ncbi:ABC transporter ATP-binding protein [Streptomyces sp. H39-S7]|uniref:ABC transporter ATP-binding protein n=1 Tax=Streptomyces sp. H39-S7 TaxID=3004357 RepID=UPI0022AF886C|nr:ABC transporter ATP-binding protein [Streptomyces sp. H39-S7]MCZ4124932.1 ABC transporter ATP-binding protein [Streptomyces sp. H39-S7]